MLTERLKFFNFLKFPLGELPHSECRRKIKAQIWTLNHPSCLCLKIKSRQLQVLYLLRFKKRYKPKQSSAVFPAVHASQGSCHSMVNLDCYLVMTHSHLPNNVNPQDVVCLLLGCVTLSQEACRSNITLAQARNEEVGAEITKKKY